MYNITFPTVANDLFEYLFLTQSRYCISCHNTLALLHTQLCMVVTAHRHTHNCVWLLQHTDTHTAVYGCYSTQTHTHNCVWLLQHTDTHTDNTSLLYLQPRGGAVAGIYSSVRSTDVVRPRACYTCGVFVRYVH